MNPNAPIEFSILTWIKPETCLAGRQVRNPKLAIQNKFKKLQITNPKHTNT
jgi:hypothetical protein